VPAQPRFRLGVLPALAQVVLQGVVPAAVDVLRARRVAVVVGRRVVVLVVVLAVHVRAVLVFAAPVLGLAGGVDALGHALAGRRARERARGAADEHADRTGQRADRGTRRGAAD